MQGLIRFLASFIFLMPAGGATMAASGVGFIRSGPEPGQLTIYLDGPIVADSGVSAQWVDGKGAVRCCRWISARQLRDLGPAEDVMFDPDGDPAPARAYRVEGRVEATLHPFIGMVALGRQVTAPGPRQLAFKRDGHRHTTRLCAGKEGLNLYTFTRNRATGRAYLGLGYAIEPDADPLCAAALAAFSAP